MRLRARRLRQPHRRRGGRERRRPRGRAARRALSRTRTPTPSTATSFCSARARTASRDRLPVLLDTERHLPGRTTGRSSRPRANTRRRCGSTPGRAGLRPPSSSTTYRDGAARAEDHRPRRAGQPHAVRDERQRLPSRSRSRRQESRGRSGRPTTSSRPRRRTPWAGSPATTTTAAGNLTSETIETPTRGRASPTPTTTTRRSTSSPSRRTREGREPVGDQPATGDLRSMTRRRGNTTTYDYDGGHGPAHGRALDPRHFTTDLDHDSFGQPGTASGPCGNVRTTRVRRAGPPGTTHRTPRSTTAETDFDGLDRPVAVSRGRGRRVATTRPPTTAYYPGGQLRTPDERPTAP